MQESEYGDFKETEEEQKTQEKEQLEQFPTRVKLLRQGELIGIVLQRLGGNRMSVKTTDNKTRNCRVPGKFRRKFWLREGNYVVIKPWPDDNNKGDIIYQYRSGDLIQLKKRNLLKNLDEEF